MHTVCILKFPQMTLKCTHSWEKPGPETAIRQLSLFIFQNYSVSPGNSGSCLPHPHLMDGNQEIRDDTDGSVLYIMKNVNSGKIKRISAE